MAGCQPCSRSEDQSPQLSFSGYPLEAVRDEERPGPSGEEAGGRRDLRVLTRKEEGVQKSERSM